MCYKKYNVFVPDKEHVKSWFGQEWPRPWMGTKSWFTSKGLWERWFIFPQVGQNTDGFDILIGGSLLKDVFLGKSEAAHSITFTWTSRSTSITLTFCRCSTSKKSKTSSSLRLMLLLRLFTTINIGRLGWTCRNIPKAQPN